MDSKARVEVLADPSRNVLHMLFRGHVTFADLNQVRPTLETRVAELTRGFSLVTDLVDLDTMDLTCEPVINQVMDSCQKHHIGMVVRIIPDPRKDIGLNILGRFHYTKDVRIVTCDTREEAERLVAK